MKHLLLTVTTFGFLTTNTAFAGNCAAENADTPPALIEIVQFQLADGVSQAAFLSAASATEPFLCAAQGFVRRNLSVDENGLWTDYIEWSDAEAAMAAAQTAQTLPQMQPFMASIDMASMQFTYSDLHYTVE